MPGLVAAGTPLTYSVPVVPDNVTARWLSIERQLTAAAEPLLGSASPMVIATRTSARIHCQEHVDGGAGAEVEDP